MYGGGSYTEYVYISNIPELSAVRLSTEALVFGGSVSISRLMEQLTFAAENFVGFTYVTQLVETWKYLGNTSLRNVSERVLEPMAGNCVLLTFYTLLHSEATVYTCVFK